MEASNQRGAHQPIFTTPSFVATLFAFGLFGFLTGVWEVLLVDLRTALSLSPGAFGAALTAGFIGAPPAMVLGRRIIERFSPQIFIGISGIVMGLALFGLS